MEVKHFFDERTSTLTYIVYDPNSKDCVIIDPVLDFDPASGRIWEESADLVIQFVEEKNLKPHFILETHVHADHLTGAQVLKKTFPNIKTFISQEITQVQEVFSDLFHVSIPRDGSQFDRLLKHGETFSAGSIQVQVLHTPGHTPACLSYRIGNLLFTGDAIFMPDSGTGRCDFPKGDAKALYHSITQVIYKLPSDTRIFVGHDYQPGGRKLLFETTVGEEMKKNIHVTSDTTLEKFVQFRTERDRTLSAPKLLLPSIQVNMVSGRLPTPESNGVSYLKIPLRPTVKS